MLNTRFNRCAHVIETWRAGAASLAVSALRRPRLAGVTCYPPHVRREGRPDSLANVLDHAEHIAEICGVEHVAIGADLDGFDPPGLPDGADSPSVYGMIEAGLLARGWRRGQVDLALGGNARRVLASVLR